MREKEIGSVVDERVVYLINALYKSIDEILKRLDKIECKLEDKHE